MDPKDIKTDHPINRTSPRNVTPSLASPANAAGASHVANLDRSRTHNTDLPKGR